MLLMHISAPCKHSMVPGVTGCSIADRQLLNRAHAGSTTVYHMPQKGRAALQVPRGKSVGLPRRMSGCLFGPTSD